MSRAADRTTGRTRLALLVAALCVPGLLMLADGSDATASTASQGPVSGSSSPEARFNDLVYPVPFYGRLFTSDEKDDPISIESSETFFTSYFARVGTEDRSGDLDLSIAVEGQPDPSGYQLCLTASSCTDVEVRVTADGLLYLYTPARFHYFHIHLGDFPRLPVELSASDADSGLKVYREVLVTPPTAAAGCEDYGDNTPEAYTCLFLRELLPTEAVGSVSESTLRAALPDLVQDHANYSLVLAEEFDGTPPAANEAGCSDGLSTLNNTVWGYYDACAIVDSLGEPCGNVVDGALVMGDSGLCASKLLGDAGSFTLATYGKWHAKYGYLEVKYSFNVDAWPSVYNNFNLVMFTRGKYMRFLMDRYGVEIEDWEDYLSKQEIEIDLIEYIPNSKEDIAHQYANWGNVRSGFRPIRSDKRTFYCKTDARSPITNPETCTASDTFTVTRGIEWTPRGYRTFVKVDGFHDDLTVLPKDKIAVQVKNDGRTQSNLTGTARDAYFEYVDPEDTDTLLEQIAVAHAPLPIATSVWGWLGPKNHPSIRTRMKIDYIRFWQPDNHYSDMEPVFQ